MYDPTTARWLSRDPISFRGGDANLYRYVGNRPTYATDPSGLLDPGAWASWTWDVGAAAGGAIGSGLGTMGTAVAQGVWDMGAAPLDIIGTSVCSNWKPRSYYGEATQAAMQSGGSYWSYAGPAAFGVGANVLTLGGYGAAQGGINYAQTGDPTQFQQGSIGFLTGTLGAAQGVTALNRGQISGVFNAYGQAPGFSGVVSRVTGEMRIRPSTLGPPLGPPLPPGYVNQIGGHLVVSRTLSRFKCFHRGFSVSREPGNSLGMGWNSRQLNPGRRIAPHFESMINRAIRRATGLDVFDR